MQPAFFMMFLFPPPSSGTDIFAGLNGAGTWLAANTGETLIV
jgi:hypothetical protein